MNERVNLLWQHPFFLYRHPPPPSWSVPGVRRRRRRRGDDAHSLFPNGFGPSLHLGGFFLDDVLMVTHEMDGVSRGFCRLLFPQCNAGAELLLPSADPRRPVSRRLFFITFLFMISRSFSFRHSFSLALSSLLDPRRLKCERRR